MRYIDFVNPSKSVAERADTRALAFDVLRSRGTQDIPERPRSVIAQSGSRKVVVTWELPVRHDSIAGWRIYKGNEDTLYRVINDKGCRQVEVDCSAAASSDYVNVFISAVTQLGQESTKVQVQGKPTDEAGAPADPTPPTSWTDSGNGGGETGRTFDKRENGGRSTL